MTVEKKDRDPNEPFGSRNEVKQLEKALSNVRRQREGGNISVATNEEWEVSLDKNEAKIKGWLDSNEQKLQSKMEKMDPSDRAQLESLDQQFSQLSQQYDELFDQGPDKSGNTFNAEAVWQQSLINKRKEMDVVEKQVRAIEDKYHI